MNGGRNTVAKRFRIYVEELGYPIRFWLADLGISNTTADIKGGRTKVGPEKCGQKLLKQFKI